jgi:hypothetical protein
MLKSVTDCYTEIGFLGEVQFRRQSMLPVHSNTSLDIYDDLQPPVDRPCLWSCIDLNLVSDVPC